MIKINLLPPEISEEKARKHQVELIVGGIIAIVLVLLILYVMKTIELGNIEKELKDVTAAVDRESALVMQVETLQMRQSALNKRMGIIDKLVKGQFTWVKVLDEINLCLQQNIWLTSITSSKTGAEGSLTFSGIALDNFAIADFITSLESSSYFKDVELSYIEEGQEIEKTKTLQFVLTCKATI